MAFAEGAVNRLKVYDAITANQNASVSIVVKPTAPGIVGLTADLATSQDDPANSNNTDSLSFTVPTP